MSKTVVGLFPHTEDVQGALRDLESIGIGRSSVQVIGSDARNQVSGALTGVGVPADDAGIYAEAVRRGGRATRRPCDAAAR